jgi:Calcineurin-like phosphoesterase.
MYQTDWFTLPHPADGHYAAIGDVHGCAHLLRPALEHLDRSLPSSASVVLLGDLIDRGPATLECLDLARAGCGGRRMIVLGGNHESMLLSGLFEEDQDLRFGATVIWYRNGGAAVLDEVNVPGIGIPDGAQLAAALGAERVEFLKSMLPHHRAGQVLFTHAGLNPDLELAAQLAQPVMDFRAVMEAEDGEDLSMRWVRKGWVGLDRPLSETRIGEDLFVVYGHTIQEDGVLMTRCQAGIDVGSFKTGRLCISEVDHDRIRFQLVSARPEPASVAEPG